MLVTAIAPIVWGATYVVTRQYLPADSPLWGSVLRALPAGLVLLAFTRVLPHGSWWWKTVILGTLNIGAFFVLVYVAAQRLPSSIAATLMAMSAAAMMLLAWPLLSERPRATSVVGAGIGVVGVAVMLLSGGMSVDPVGVAASVAAMLMSSVGFILTRRWVTDEGVLVITSWQLVAGGIVLVPVALVVEGGPPAMDPQTLAAFAFVSLIATTLAYSAWFAGLHHLPASTVGLIGLLNPVTGVILGTVLAAEVLGPRQAIGIALVLTGILVGQRKQLPRIGNARQRGTMRVPIALQPERVPLAEPCTIPATSSR
jgi:probable blue pigment (indigoidine) exporter